MPGPFQGIHTASTALRAFQRALDVTGNNVANVNTPGFSRQRVELTTLEPTLFFQGGAFTLGNGVGINSITRIRDMFLEQRRFGAEGNLGRSQTLVANLDQIERMFLEPGGQSIGDSLTKFWNGWSALASNPTDRGARVQVQLAGRQVADRIRGTWHSLESQRRQLDAQVQQTFGDINRLADTVAALNREIRAATATGAEPNELMDRRDQAIRELSGLANINTYRFDDGTTTVYMGNFALVDPVGSHAVPTTYDPAAGTFTDGVQTYTVQNGRLKGLFDSLNQVVATQGQLDQLSLALRTEVNTLHMSGITGNGATNVQFFVGNNPPPVPPPVPPIPDLGAQDFRLSALVDADPLNIAAGTTAAPGDTGLALALAALRDDATTMPGGRTFNRFTGDLVSDVGRAIGFNRAAEEAERAMVEQIDRQIQSVSGVSLDDEMTNLLRFQRSYQAAAKTLATFDQVTEELIGMLRR